MKFVINLLHKRKCRKVLHHKCHKSVTSYDVT